MRHDAVTEEGPDPAARAVDELIRHHQVSRRDLLAQAADRTHRDHALGAEVLEGPEVGSEGQLRGQKAMSAPVPRQEHDRAPLELAGDVGVGRTPEGRVDPALLHAFEQLDRVETGAADDTEQGLAATHDAAPVPAAAEAIESAVSSAARPAAPST